jgi:hypothetical protein
MDTERVGQVCWIGFLYVLVGGDFILVSYCMALSVLQGMQYSFFYINVDQF